jgi:hypothetical protein
MSVYTTTSLGFMVCRCGVRRRWSTAKVEVMRVRANGLGATKDEN